MNGRTIVYGSPYCSRRALAKYSVASFWNPYVETGGGHVQLRALGRRETVAFSNTIDDEMTVIFCSRPVLVRVDRRVERGAP